MAQVTDDVLRVAVSIVVRHSFDAIFAEVFAAGTWVSALR
jgi:hypothetical protein